MKKVTYSQAKETLEYSPETGEFVRLVAAGGAKVGDRAGTDALSGYRQINVAGVLCYAHRLAWLIMTGEWPADQIDHINGIRNDNRWCNLRQADALLNGGNQRKPRRNNKLGTLGVSFVKNRFYARIRVNRKMISLGGYETADLAYQAYVKAKRELHPGGML